MKNKKKKKRKGKNRLGSVAEASKKGRVLTPGAKVNPALPGRGGGGIKSKGKEGKGTEGEGKGGVG